MPVIVWSIKHAARLVPGATCLTQALAVRHYLARMGEPSTIRIGVRPSDTAALDAHAWVIHHGRILIGGADYDLRSFTPLIDL